MVTVYTVTLNEEVMIEFFIKHYRSLFPDCKIVVHDNGSSDDTIAIANDYGCEVRPFDTGNAYVELRHIELKNHCWKESATNWNVICDCDELVCITHEELLAEESRGVNMIRFEAYTMINNTDVIDIPGMKYGYRDIGYDKQYLFDKRAIQEINYAAGSHTSSPVSNAGVVWSDRAYRALHYKLLSPAYTFQRNQLFHRRHSEQNLALGMGVHYSRDNQWWQDFYDHYSQLAVQVL